MEFLSSFCILCTRTKTHAHAQARNTSQPTVLRDPTDQYFQKMHSKERSSIPANADIANMDVKVAGPEIFNSFLFVNI